MEKNKNWKKDNNNGWKLACFWEQI